MDLKDAISPYSVVGLYVMSFQLTPPFNGLLSAVCLHPLRYGINLLVSQINLLSLRLHYCFCIDLNFEHWNRAFMQSNHMSMSRINILNNKQQNKQQLVKQLQQQNKQQT